MQKELPFFNSREVHTTGCYFTYSLILSIKVLSQAIGLIISGGNF